MRAFAIASAVVFVACSRHDSPRADNLENRVPTAQSPLTTTATTRTSWPFEREYDDAVEVLAPSVLRNEPPPRSLPSHVMLSNLPSIANQDGRDDTSIGSCETMAFGYALGSYAAARTPDGQVRWDASRPENQPSAAFLYAWELRLKGDTCPSGSMGVPYLSRLVAVGAPTAADVPYRADCSYLSGKTFLDGKFPDDPRMRIGSFATTHLGMQRLPLVKELISVGYAMSFSGPILKDYFSATLDKGVFYSKGLAASGGHHAQLIVGYDDARGTAAKPGAFLVQNSMGAKWPSAAPGGRMWVSYEALMETQDFAAVAYPRDESAASVATPTPTGGGGGTKLTQDPPTRATIEAVIPRAFQYASGKTTFLVVPLRFTEPVVVKSISMTEPGGSGKTVVGILENMIHSGYIHMRREDNKAFTGGRWSVKIETETIMKTPITYAGAVTIAAIAGRSASPLVDPLYGPVIGKRATLR